jgi:hypothetical protein
MFENLVGAGGCRLLVSGFVHYSILIRKPGGAN